MSSIDRGGLDYSIKISDEFSSALGRFHSGIKEAREGLQGLQESAKGFRAASRQSNRAASESAATLERSTRAGRERINQEKDLTRQAQNRAAALAQLNREARRQEITEQRAIVSRRSGYRIEQRALSALAARQRAEKSVTRELDRRRVAQEKFRAAAERAIRTEEELNVRQRQAQAAQKAQEAADNARIRALRENIRTRLTEQVKIENEVSKARERTAKEAVKIDERAEKERQRALKEAIKARLAEEVKLEKEITKARERASREQIKIQERESRNRSRNLRLNIQERLKAEVQREELIRQARERVALNLQKQAEEEDKRRVAALRENITARLSQSETRKTLRDRIRDFFQLGDAVNRANDRANRLSFTFRRLFGILAAFAVARALIAGFRDLVRESVAFNANMEQATLGIASLLTAVGEVRDAMGDTVTESRALAVAQAEARRQVNLLRKDALQTIATFEELLDTFQIAIAPGFQAGLDIDEIRRLSVRISQAAAAIGLPQNQLAEEIRSLLTGTIQQRTTRIAVALGITNEDIRNAQEAGRLVEFLQERFAAFAVAGEEALSTFNGLLNRVRDGLRLVLGSGGLEFFASLKNLLAETFDALTNTDQITGLIEPNPQVLEFVEAIASGLAVAVDEAVRLGQALSPRGAVAFARLLGATIATVARILSAMVEGAIAGFGDVAGVISLIAEAVDSIPGIDLGIDPRSLQTIISLLSRIVVWFVAIRSLSLAINGLIALMAVRTVAWNTVMGLGRAIALAIETAWISIRTAITGARKAALAFNVTSGGLSAVLLTSLAAVSAIVAALSLGTNELRKWYSELLGIELRFTTLRNLLTISLGGAITEFVLEIEYGFKRLVQEIRVAFLQIVDFVQGTADDILVGVLRVLSKISDTAASELERIEGLRERDEKLRQKEIEDEKAKIDAIKQQLEALKALNKEKERQDFAAEVANNENNQTVAEIAKELLEGIQETIGGFVENIFGRISDKIDDTINDSLEGADEEARKLSEVFAELPGVVARSSATIGDQVEIIEELREEAKRAADELRQGLAVIGVSGNVQNQRIEIFRAEFELRERTLQLDRQTASLQRELTGTLRQQEETQRRISSLSEEDQERVRRGIELAQDYLRTENDVAKANEQIAVARQRLNEALERGLTDEAEAIRSQIEQHIAARDAIAQRVEQIKAEADLILEGAENTVLLRGLIQDAIVLRGRERSITNQVNSLLADRAYIENQINEALERRLELLATQQAFDLRRQTREITTEIANLQAELASVDANADQRRLIQAESALRSLQTEIGLARQLREIEHENLLTVRSQTAERLRGLQLQLQSTASAEERAELERQIEATAGALAAIDQQRAALEQRNLAALTKENLELQKINQELALARRIVEEPISTGVVEGLKEFARTAPTLYQSTFDLVRGGLEELSQVGARALASVFDPSQNQSVAQMFGDFLAGLAQSIFQAILQYWFAQIITSMLAASATTATPLLTAATTLTAAAGAWAPVAGTLLAAAQTLLIANSLGGGAVGLQRGGNVGEAFEKARGFASGGRPSHPAPASIPRPKGLHPDDRVPIWAAMDEWVIRARSVRKYGNAVMAAINEGRIDPTSLRALAGVRRGATARRGMFRHALGFNEGGAVGRAMSASSPSRPQAPQPALAVVLATEDAADTLFANGQNAFLKTAERLRDPLRAILGVGQ